jgi:sugar phosphate isomerase/epimerase
LLSQTGRREIVQIVRSHELSIASVACVMRHGLDVQERQESRIAYVKDVLTLSKDLGAALAIVPSGQIDADKDSRSNALSEAVRELANYADRIGATLALELADNTPDLFAAFLAGFDTGALGACLDPAGLFSRGIDPAEAVGALQKWIGYVQARDARQTASSRAGTIVPLGEGDIDWMKLLTILEEAGYRGWFGIDEPLTSSATSISLLRRASVS